MKLVKLISAATLFSMVVGCAQFPGSRIEPQLVLAAAGKAPQTEQLVCPGTGAPDCEANWQALQLGFTLADAQYWLGEDFISQQKIFIDRVEKMWKFPTGGQLIFSNGSLISMVIPADFLFPLSTQAVTAAGGRAS